MALAAIVTVLLAAHLLLLGLAAKFLALPAAAVVGVIAVALIKHLGLFAPLGAWLRRRGQGLKPSVRPGAPPASK